MATVGKKFTDPCKWDTAFFYNLNPHQKLLYLFIFDRCDHAGVIEFMPGVWSAHLGIEINEEFIALFVESINSEGERIRRIGRKLWLVDYTRFNQTKNPKDSLSSSHKFHLHIYKRFESHGLIEMVNERDPILLKDFYKDSDDEFSPKPLESHTEALPKTLSKSPSNSKGRSTSESLGSLYRLVKKTWPHIEYPEITILAELGRIEKQVFEDGVKIPIKYIEGAISDKDWDDYDQFMESFESDEPGEVPF